MTETHRHITEAGTGWRDYVFAERFRWRDVNLHSMCVNPIVLQTLWRFRYTFQIVSPIDLDLARVCFALSQFDLPTAADR